jgi:hypothetical protein
MTSDLWFVVVVVVTGDKGEVDGQEAKLYGIAGAFGGIPGGERAYILTFCHRSWVLFYYYSTLYENAGSEK